MEKTWEWSEGEGPVIATAVHDGHRMREELAGHVALTDLERLREEDPHTADWAAVGDTTLVVHHSRFELDVNRPKEGCVYLTPDQAWGLQVWSAPLPEDIVRRSYKNYDAFYEDAARQLDALVERYAKLLLLDIHTYNHRRAGSEEPEADWAANPEINLGTKSIDAEYWRPIIDEFVSFVAATPYWNAESDPAPGYRQSAGGPEGDALHTGENTKFGGGYFSRWIGQRYPKEVCVLAIEFKKFFMDEWSGKLYANHHEKILKLLEGATAAMRPKLQDM
jgi:hypothetical protein